MCNAFEQVKSIGNDTRGTDLALCEERHPHSASKEFDGAQCEIYSSQPGKIDRNHKLKLLCVRSVRFWSYEHVKIAGKANVFPSKQIFLSNSTRARKEGFTEPSTPPFSVRMLGNEFSIEVSHHPVCGNIQKTLLKARPWQHCWTRPNGRHIFNALMQFSKAALAPKETVSGQI